ncbi:hypothetical protein HBA54_07270 [Pelagibius litoralis]|uniref:Uncharacterized protein n=1 Tax=Pelagibius litoralis TaxID=374515 RepID=A0A967EVU3_9PROT|nr:hypothetical protein [Pelagibius litoralis]NIA68389.1 hypothetical protein [Pelagibius litoralis]
MTGVSKLLLLPAPDAKPSAPSAVAAQNTGTQQAIEAVVRSPAADRRDGQTAQQRGSVEERRWQEQQGSQGRSRAVQVQEPAKGRLISFSGLTSMPFMVQVLGQEQAQTSQGSRATPQSALSQHRDGALMGSDIYRKAGGEPEIMPESATFIRIAV